MLSVVLALALLAGSPPPAEVARVLPIAVSDGRGYATPVSPLHLLTADHMSEAGELRYALPDGTRGSARRVWRDQERDLALYMADRAPGWQTVRVADRLPDPQAEVWWRMYLAGARGTTLRGNVLGLDVDGDLVIDGTVHPGASGSGVINAEGELVAVVSSSWNPVRTDPMARASFRALLVAKPVIGRPWDHAALETPGLPTAADGRAGVKSLSASALRLAAEATAIDSTEVTGDAGSAPVTRSTLRDLALDAAAIAAANAFDAWTTSEAIDAEARVYNRGGIGAIEANRLGQTDEKRNALKLGAAGVEVGVCAWLRAGGRDGWADAFRWFVVAVNVALGANNLRIAWSF
jgi:hypothetical protein